MALVLPCFPGMHTHSYIPLSVRAWVPDWFRTFLGPEYLTGLGPFRALWRTATEDLWFLLFVSPYPRNVVSFLALPDSCVGSQPDSVLLVPCGDTFCLLSKGRRLVARASVTTPSFPPNPGQGPYRIGRLLLLLRPPLPPP